MAQSDMGMSVLVAVAALESGDEVIRLAVDETTLLGACVAVDVGVCAITDAAAKVKATRPFTPFVRAISCKQQCSSSPRK